MDCPSCKNETITSCGFASNIEDHFKIKLGGRFEDRVYVPCNKRLRFNEFHPHNATLLTKEGMTFNVKVRIKNSVTYINGEGWEELVRQYALGVGEFMNFTMSPSGGYIDVEILCDDETIPKRPIFGTLYNGLSDEMKEYVESLIWSKDMHVSLEEMDNAVEYLISQGVGETRPWLHTLTERDFTTMRVISRVGTALLEPSSNIRLVRHLGGPLEQYYVQHTSYLIRPADGRIEIAMEGWLAFLKKNTDFKVEDKVLITYHVRRGVPTLFVEKIPKFYGMCIKC